ncbi:hypothetical protein E5161_02215 [Cohnella pontilimi]|uniref:YprB ribonuclease H-like domain-containing protein n=1 Tax=Cohnella pontilimi TaxID=2564100 RepID=A0A4U0FGT6_9BACL|nr:ribonuclease H-like domain-containing protein [Cohnella pontilimi]TJY44226.1 hypothetical protein E5161_02215 [Cohnella pontilimi]
MSGLKERLERLRASAMAAQAAEKRDEAESTEWSARESASSPTSAEEAAKLHPAFRRLGVEECTNEAGSFLLRRIVYPYPYRHGRYALEDLRLCAPHLQPVAWRQNRSDKKKRWVPETADEFPAPEASGLLFLDTETTGLGVGTGNVPFMIGIGRYRQDAFVVEQTLIRHPGEERAMLTWLQEQFRGVTHLVTYNGRTFDWPVLVNRFILNGWRRSSAEPGHLDLLHPSRALWKYTLPTCRLSTVEEERLGIIREQDVPGSLAPELYVRYLGDGNPEHLYGVYVHNEKDVLTLASLAVHFGHLLGGGLGTAAEEPTDAEERFRTGAWLEQHGQPSEAERLYDLLAEATEQGEGGGEIGWRLALAAKYKRLGSLHRAVPMWEQAASLAEASRLPRLEAHLELAMYYEHRLKDFASALRYAESALGLARRRASLVRLSAAGRQERERLERRVNRLKRKLLREQLEKTAGFAE